MRHLISSLLPLLPAILIACGPSAPEQAAQGETPPAAPPPVEDQVAATPQDLFWKSVTALCGQAFAGTMTSSDEADASFAGQAMTMHVRRCTEDRLEIPFHVGENRSRTWVLTRLEDGIQLQHDHRHEDGSEDSVTLYGGRTTDLGTANAQQFPADAYSKKLFEENDLAVSVTNVWSFEIEPGSRFSYILRRPERHFQADFDLRAAVPEPPAPWGH